MSDTLAASPRYRVLTVIDLYSREALAREAARRMNSEFVTSVLDRVIAQHKRPLALTLDYGT